MFLNETKGPILVVAPHPDDETLAAGGTLLRALEAGIEVHWLIVTGITVENGWPEAKVSRRAEEIEEVASAYPFTRTHRLDLPSAALETLPLGEIVAAIGAVVKEVEPEVLLVPHRGDAHSDHHVVHAAALACSKWFRYPSVRAVLVYEALSETDVGLFRSDPFEPQLFVDIGQQLERKLELVELFGDEIGEHPFPRSRLTVESLARVRGAASGYDAAEAFMILRMRDGPT